MNLLKKIFDKISWEWAIKATLVAILINLTIYNVSINADNINITFQFFINYIV